MALPTNKRKVTQMAFNSTRPAAGNSMATGMPRTPAPLRQAPPDAVDTIRNPTKQNYGENGPANNMSRTNPGQFVESDLARNMRQSSDDGESVLDKIIAGKGNENFQTRTLSPDRVPVHSAMSGAAPGPKVPDRCGQLLFDPTATRKP